MEPISSVLGLGGIPAIFTSCVDCYRYIQLGREFEDTFETAWCRLQASQLRLTRWGASMGIDGPDAKLSWDGYSEDDLKKAQRWLEKILDAFQQAIEISAEYEETAKPDELQRLEPDTQMQKEGRKLSKLSAHMCAVAEKRFRPRKRDRVSWALYRKGAFEALIDRISILTNNLVELFPSAAGTQKQLCEGEVRGLDKSSLTLFEGAVGKEDKMLLAAIRAEAERAPNFYSDVEVGGRFRGHFGDNVAAGETSRRKTFTNIRAGESAVVHFGDNIGNFQGRTVHDYVRVDSLPIYQPGATYLPST